MGNIPNLGPTILNGIANSAGVFFGLPRKSARMIVSNTGANPLLYHFKPFSGDASFRTLNPNSTEPQAIVDQVMGIHVKSVVSTTFEVVASYDYLR